jgi:hypothetical protein
MTPEAKGVLIELLSRPEDWVVYKKQFLRTHRFGKTGSDKVDRIFKELQQFGHLQIITDRDNNTGQILDRFWLVFEEPQLVENKEKLPNTRFTQVRLTPPRANHGLQIKKKTNKDKNKNKKLHTSEKESAIKRF